VITIPIFDYECGKCGNVWENVEVWASHAPKKCPKCKSKKFTKVFNSTKQQIRMNSDDILHNLPDARPPLEELRGKGTEGYKDKPEADIRKMTYSKDKYGNKLWRDKKISYFHSK
jgi:putative FmdB family regulatory protein